MRIYRFYTFFLFLLISVLSSYAQQLKFMGIPLCSDLSQYSEVLKAKRFKDKYPSGSLAHQYWEGGDFWKISRCYVQLFISSNQSDMNMRNKVTSLNINLPFPYFDLDLETYKKMLSELVQDYAETYGMDFRTEKRNNYETKKDDLVAHIWTVSDGEVEMIVNWNAVWGVEITYTSSYVLKKKRETTTFRGSGKNDL